MRAERVLDGNRIRTAATGRQKLHGKIIYSIIVNFCFPHTNYNINNNTQKDSFSILISIFSFSDEFIQILIFEISMDLSEIFLIT
jgi:hypothetical protein